MTTVLARPDIQHRLERKPPLVESWVNLDEQLQANGIDLTLRDIALFETCGQITVDNTRRVISDLAPLVFDRFGAMELMPGSYLVTYNEIVNLPRDLMALAMPRSSLLRCGVTIHTAVWDAGYSGRAQSLMVVYNPRGFRLQRNARIVQLIFLSLTGETDGYHGIYLGENMK